MKTISFKKSFFCKILHKITIFVWKNVFLKHVFTRKGQVGSKKFQCKMSLKFKKSIEIDISVFKYVCLAFFVYAMMYPTMQALKRLAASRRLHSATFQVILATGW